MECSLSNKVLLLATLLFLTISCKNQQESEVSQQDEKPELIIYEPSEMANLMNGMYAYNLQLKEQIINGETPVAMPIDLLMLHSAEMSNGHSRSNVWNANIDGFIKSQQAVVDTLSNVELKQRYNSAINNCLACHKTECTGPIPKIKKLLIQ